MISSAISFLPFCFSCRYRVVSLFWKRSGRHFPRLQAAGFSQGAAAQRSLDHLFGAAAQHGAGQLRKVYRVHHAAVCQNIALGQLIRKAHHGPVLLGVVQKRSRIFPGRLPAAAFHAQHGCHAGMHRRFLSEHLLDGIRLPAPLPGSFPPPGTCPAQTGHPFKRSLYGKAGKHKTDVARRSSNCWPGMGKKRRPVSENM